MHDSKIHSLLTDPFTQKLDTGRAISLNNVIFHAEFDGVVHVLDFLCANVIKMKKN